MTVRTRNVILASLTRIGIVVALLAISISIYAVLVRTRAEPTMTDVEAVVPSIAVVQARAMPVSQQWTGFGNVAPASGAAANVPAQVRGVVEEIPPGMVAGAAVRRGDVLVQLDDADYRDEVEATRQRIAEIEGQIDQLAVEFRAWTDRLEMAQEDVAIARRDLERVLNAQERGSATQREVDQLRTALIVARRAEVQVREQLERIEPRQRQLQAVKRQQQVSLQLAERNLARCTITSPIDGIVQRIDVEHGESVGMDQRVARVVDLRRIEVPLRLPAAARASVRTGDQVIIRSAGASRHDRHAVINRIAPEDDGQSRTVTVYIDIEQQTVRGSPLTVDGSQNRQAKSEKRKPQNILTPGMFVEGLVTTSTAQDRVVLPRRAVHSDRVWVVDEDGTLHSRRIDVLFSIRESFPQLGIDDTSWVAVNDPELNGRMVVLDGARLLSEGSRIDPVLPEQTEEAGLAARNGLRRESETTSSQRNGTGEEHER